MIAVSNVKSSSIRGHYDLATPFYRFLWGPHIHHGLWLNDASTPYQAQCQLTDTLADLAGVNSNTHLLDVGCGMGGSSIRLASRRHCHCHGVTLSPVQKRWATATAVLRGLSKRTRFQAADIEKLDFAPQSFDVIWSIECTEHLFDKANFFKRAATWLKPGGLMAIVVWFEGSTPQPTGHKERLEELCQRFVCPLFATVEEYTAWMKEAGLVSVGHHDWTEHASRTWKICKERVAKTGVDRLATWISREQTDFINGFDKLMSAFESGDMQYGALIAQR